MYLSLQNSLLLSKGCFLLLLLKPRTCTEYTLKVLKFQYVIICWSEENDYIWTDARRPVPRLWIRSAEVRGGGGGGVVRRMGTQQQQQNDYIEKSCLRCNIWALRVGVVGGRRR